MWSSNQSLPTTTLLDSRTSATQAATNTASASTVIHTQQKALKVAIRAHFDDMAAIMAAVGSYAGVLDGHEVGLRIIGRGEWLGALMGMAMEEQLWG
jgi:hypothetical protein